MRPSGSASVHTPGAYHLTAMMRPLLVVLTLAAPGLAGGQTLDAPERIARLSYIRGLISYQEADQPAGSGLPGGPLAAGDRLDTGPSGRAELTLGTATLRLAEATRLTIAELDDSAVRFDLANGSASLHVRELRGDETFELKTPDTTVAFIEPGEFRVDVLPSGMTELAVRTGAAEVATADGAVRVVGGQRVQFAGRDAVANLGAPRPTDEFDEWVLEREVLLAEAAPPYNEDSDYYGDGALDEYGDWYDDPGYGRVWMPSYAYGGYDPFNQGYWSYTGYGYSWIDPMPWSPYTYHYGYWAYLPQYNRYGWVAERRREYRRRAERANDLFERVNQEARREDLIPDSRTSGNAREAARGERSSSDQLARRLDTDRRAPQQRADAPETPSRGSAAAAQRNAAASAAAAAAVSRSGSSSQGSSPSQGSRSSSIGASRPSSQSQSTSKGFGKPQDP